MKKIALMMALLIVFALSGCGAVNNADNSSEKNTKSTTESAATEDTGWKFFDTISEIGDTYGEVQQRHEDMEYYTMITGGSAFTLPKEKYDVIFGAPYDCLDDSTPCTAMMGSMKEIFNYSEIISKEVFEDSVGVSLEESEFDEEITLYGDKMVENGSYSISVSNGGADWITPEDVVMVIFHDECDVF